MFVNKNGRHYPEDVMAKALKAWMEDLTPAYVMLGPPDENSFDMRQVVGLCEGVVKEDDYYVVTTKILVERLPSDVLKTLQIKTAGSGKVEDGVVTEMKLRCLYFDKN